MNAQNINSTGQLLNGGGLAYLANDVRLGLLLIAVGTALQVLVAVLNKYNIPVAGQQQ